MTSLGRTTVWDGPHAGEGEVSDREEVADDKVLYTDYNLDSPCPCTAQVEELEGGAWGEGVLVYFWFLTVLVC